MSFRAILIEQTVVEGRIHNHSAHLRDLPEDFLASSGGENPVDIDVQCSALNYKDALAVTGKPGVARISPLIPGIDVVGRVRASADHRFAPGESVVLTGGGVGERAHGGLARFARVPGEHLIRLPEGISPKRAAAIGTAGFTAMLAVLALERHGIHPDRGPVVVTGAAGGVGSVAIALLDGLGYSVTAVSGRASSEAAYLHRLGANDVVDRSSLSAPGPALQKRRWAAGIDTAGARILANVLAGTHDDGVVAACGLAQGPELPATVMPFILRGVTLAGINSVTASRELREQAWQRLSRDLDLDILDEMTTSIALHEVPRRAEALLDGKVRGRTSVALTETGVTS